MGLPKNTDEMSKLIESCKGAPTIHALQAAAGTYEPHDLEHSKLSDEQAYPMLPRSDKPFPATGLKNLDGTK